jgi:hypothetical protein
MDNGVRTRRRRIRISPQEATFIEVALQAASPFIRKQALQRLCSLYRRGGVLAAPQRMKGFIIHALVDEDSKVKRWAFNALAQLGEPADIALMIGPWKNNRSESEVFEAGLTALARLVPKEELLVILREAGVEVDPGVLMALGQQTNEFKAELAGVRLEVGRATDGELRAATLLIGLKQAPDTLFSGRFPVSDVIGDLNTHHDPIVAQYSFWATVEHPDLGLDNVRVPASDFPKLPPNVQSWAYRTLTKDGSNAAQHYDAIVGASESPFAEVREGVAIGLRDIYYDSLDITVADWLLDEPDTAVSDRLLEHMACHVARSSAYRDEVLKAYREAGNGSVLRSRLEAANRDAAVALELRRIALQMNDPDLFASMVAPTMTNTQNFNNVVNAGGISNSGTGNEGSVQIISTAQARATALPVLEQLLQALEATNAPNGAAEGAEIAKEAIATPTKGKVERVVGWLKKVKDGGDAVAGIGALAIASYDKLAPLVEHLPNVL